MLPSSVQDTSLAGADGKGITNWGKVLVGFFNGRIVAGIPLVLAAVSKPILGADCFTTHNLLVDTATTCVLDAETLLPVGGSTEPLALKFALSIHQLYPNGGQLVRQLCGIGSLFWWHDFVPGRCVGI
jgi:hypothetical protein